MDQPSRPRPLDPAARKRRRRSFWLRTLIQWHWISSAICLVGMVLFAVTGITLNHAPQIETEPEIVNLTAEVPPELLASVNEHAPAETDSAALHPVPPELARWLSEQFPRAIGSRPAEWSEHEIYLSMPTPGADAWLALDRESGMVEFESTERGWIAYLNDLHKGRNAGAAWKWFLDVFAVATLVFCLTGLFLLFMHARQRRMTWPLVSLGLVIPMLLAILLIH